MKFVAFVLCALATSAFAAERITLFNGRDLAGWKLYLKDNADASQAAAIRDGVLHLDGGKVLGYVRTEASFAADFHLHVEWRWPGRAGNSGVLVHMTGPDVVWPPCFEAQLQSGHAGDVIAMGTTIDAPIVKNRTRLLVRAPSLEKPPGEWNSYDIYARGDTLETVVNGTHRALAKKLSATSGHVALELEGAPIEFRNVWLEKL